MNHNGDTRSEDLRKFAFSGNEYLRIYLALQHITGLHVQQDLLKWIDEFCDQAEAEFDLAKPRYNPRRSHG